MAERAREVVEWALAERDRAARPSTPLGESYYVLCNVVDQLVMTVTALDADPPRPVPSIGAALRQLRG